MSWFASKNDPNTNRPTAAPLPPSSTPAPAPQKPVAPVLTVKGVDVSHWEPTMDWVAALSVDQVFAMAKASDGSGSPDAKFAFHRDNAEKGGVIFAGGYHFFRFRGLSPKEQADLFFKTMGPIRAGEIAPFLDFEWDNITAKDTYGDGKETDAAGNDLFIEFAERVEELFQVTPKIYTGRSFMPMKDDRFSRFGLWVFDYHSTGSPLLPPSWTKWEFWQYTNNLAGREALVGPGNELDGNYFNGTLEYLNEMRKK